MTTTAEYISRIISEIESLKKENDDLRHQLQKTLRAAEIHEQGIIAERDDLRKKLTALLEKR